MSIFEIILTIINILAIIIIPIVAVFVGQKLQNRSQKRKDKLEIFRMLMMNRGIGWTVETVRALNIVDIVFADDNTVKTSWKEYYDKLCIQNPNDMQCKQIREAQYKLLEAMACSLGYKGQITWETIQNPYIPQGMWDAMLQQQNIQKGHEQLINVAEILAQNIGSTNSQSISTTVERKEGIHANT